MKNKSVLTVRKYAVRTHFALWLLPYLSEYCDWARQGHDSALFSFAEDPQDV